MKHDTVAPSPIVRDVPARAPSVHSDASTPFSQAAISGVLVGSTVTMLVGAIMGKVRDGQYTWGDFWLILGIWLGGSLITTTVLWFRQLASAQRTIWAVERLTGLDVDRDGVTGEPVRWVPVNSAPVAPDRAAETWAKFEEFITTAYAKERTDLRTARSLGYSEREWKLFMDALEAARMVIHTRRGENAPRRLVPPTADACIKAMRKRGMFYAGSADSVSWVSSGSSSSSSSQ